MRIILLLLTSLLPSRANIDCMHPPERTCGFYRDCLETTYRCGAEGYPLAYGERLCEAFSGQSARFTPQGQAFLWASMHCLQTPRLLHEMTCDEVEKAALGTHVPCFTRSGFCHIPLVDKLTLTRVLLENGALNLGWEFLHQIFRMLSKCYLPLKEE
jgi:hypothetical protein